MKPLKKNKRSIIIFAVVAIILLILYLAANRYLIEHVEIDQVNPNVSNNSADNNTASNTDSDPDSNRSEVIKDDWNYQSDDLTISIQKVTTGSGDNTVTYYVADIQVLAATQIMSAFANNQYGRNIIEDTSDIAIENGAIFAVNGDYYGFRDDGIEIRKGVIYRDEPARIGLAFYKNGSIKIYDETQTSAQKLLDEGVWNTLSFGPVLLEDSQIPTNLATLEVDTNFGNHSIQGNQPRTGIGIIGKNHFVIVVVDGRSKGYSKGVTLPEYAEIFKNLGCTDAYNLDGGGSSTMYFLDRVVNNPLGKNKERGVSDILYIAE